MEFDQGLTSAFTLTLQEFLIIEDFNVNYFTTDNQKTPNQIWFFLNKHVNGKGTCYQKESTMFGKALRLLCKINRADEKKGIKFFDNINIFNVGYINFILDDCVSPNNTNFVCLDSNEIKKHLDMLFSIECEPYFFEQAIEILIKDYIPAKM